MCEQPDVLQPAKQIEADRAILGGNVVRTQLGPRGYRRDNNWLRVAADPSAFPEGGNHLVIGSLGETLEEYHAEFEARLTGEAGAPRL